MVAVPVGVAQPRAEPCSLCRGLWNECLRSICLNDPVILVVLLPSQLLVQLAQRCPSSFLQRVIQQCSSQNICVTQ